LIIKSEKSEKEIVHNVLEKILDYIEMKSWLSGWDAKQSKKRERNDGAHQSQEL
jgi:hypothetical protein